MKYYFGLLLVLIISFLSLFQAKILVSGEHQAESDILPGYLQLFLPGISFTLFVLFCLLRRLTFLDFILYSLTLIVTHYGMIFLFFVSFGFGIPIWGGLGSVVIALVLQFILKSEIKQGRFLLFGALSTLPGCIGLFTIYGLIDDGIFFGIIACGWQLAVGYLVIKQLIGQKIGWASDFDKQLREYQEEESIQES